MDELNPDNPQMPDTALSVYGQGQEALDDFPVLKAFQQYIDAEQDKARKRMVSLCIFFGVLMFVVITFFVAILFYTSTKKNELYDRLIECAMQDRARQSAGAASAVQPAQDSAAIQSLTAKLDEMQKRLMVEQEMAKKAAAEAAEKAARAAQPTAEEMEIKRLKALLDLEKEKNSIEQKRRREEELEAYRRKHYPEYYERENRTERRPAARRKYVKPEPIVPDVEEDDLEDAERDADKEIDSLLDSLKDLKPADETADDKPDVGRAKKAEKNYSIPVDVKGSSSSWVIPEED